MKSGSKPACRAQRYLSGWKEAPEPCRALLAEVPAAIQHGFAQDWTRGTELCRRAAFLLLQVGRRREGIRLLHRLLVEGGVKTRVGVKSGTKFANPGL